MIGKVHIDDGEAFFDCPFAVPTQGIILPEISRLSPKARSNRLVIPIRRLPNVSYLGLGLSDGDSYVRG